MAYAPSLVPQGRKRMWWETPEQLNGDTGPQGGTGITHQPRGMAPAITAQQQVPGSMERGAEYGQDQMDRYALWQKTRDQGAAPGGTPESMERGAEYGADDVAAPKATAPPLTLDQQWEDEYQKAAAKKKAEQTAGAKKVGKGSQILFQIAQAMSNFAAGLQGQQMKPHEDLQDVRNRGVRQRAEAEFEPYEKERKRRMEEVEAKQKAAQQAADVKIKTNTAKKQEYELANPDREYQESEGVVKSRRKGSQDPWTVEEGLGDRSKNLIERELPEGGGKFYTTGDKEADRIALKASKQAELDLQKGRMTQQQYEAHINDLRAWQKESASINNQKADLNSQATMKDGVGRSKLTEAEGYDKDAAEATAEGDLRAAATAKQAARKARQESDAAKVEAEALRTRASKLKTPPEPKLNLKEVKTTPLDTGTRVPKRPIKKVTVADLEKMTKVKKKDGTFYTIEELKKMMAEAKDAEYVLEP